MKMFMTTDEMYPVYSITGWDGRDRSWGKVVEAPDELLTEYELVTNRFYHLQDKLEALYENAN